jgi:hypothetical protein
VKLSLPQGPVFGSKGIAQKPFEAWLANSRYFTIASKGVSFERLKVMNEISGTAMQWGQFAFDGMVARDLGLLKKDGNFLLPAFAALNEKAGAEIAKHNGSNNPLAFWKRHLLIPLAEAMAELRAYTGMSHTSPHSQNILVELDKNLRPTGKIVIRDMDFYVDPEVFDVIASRPEVSFLQSDRERIVARNLDRHEGFSLQNGLKSIPSWMTQQDYANWVVDYFDAYKNKFAEITGVDSSSAFGDLLAKDTRGYFMPVEKVGFISGYRNNFHRLLFNRKAYDEPYEGLFQRAG